MPRHLKTEVSLVASEPHKLAIELAHKAAFRTGLGRSIYCPPFALNRLNSDMLQVRVVATQISSRSAYIPPRYHLGQHTCHADMLWVTKHSVQMCFRSANCFRSAKRPNSDMHQLQYSKFQTFTAPQISAYDLMSFSELFGNFQ